MLRTDDGLVVKRLGKDEAGVWLLTSDPDLEASGLEGRFPDHRPGAVDGEDVLRPKP